MQRENLTFGCQDPVSWRPSGSFGRVSTNALNSARLAPGVAKMATGAVVAVAEHVDDDVVVVVDDEAMVAVAVDVVVVGIDIVPVPVAGIVLVSSLPPPRAPKKEMIFARVRTCVFTQDQQGISS
jgi:hypothetical protein